MINNKILFFITKATIICCMLVGILHVIGWRFQEAHDDGDVQEGMRWRHMLDAALEGREGHKKKMVQLIVCA